MTASLSSSLVPELRDRQPGLLRLPPFIRLITYGLIGTSLNPIEAQTSNLNGCSQSPHITNLLLLCRAIYDEIFRLL